MCSGKVSSSNLLSSGQNENIYKLFVTIFFYFSGLIILMDDIIYVASFIAILGPFVTVLYTLVNIVKSFYASIGIFTIKIVLSTSTLATKVSIDGLEAQTCNYSQTDKTIHYHLKLKKTHISFNLQNWLMSLTLSDGSQMYSYSAYNILSYKA